MKPEELKEMPWLQYSPDGARTNLSGFDLSGADLSGADLSGFDFSHANFTSVNLPYANLSGADLSGANVSHANLSHANFSGAHLSSTRGLQWVICGWSDHGEQRRTLICVNHGEEGWIYHCGCFRGDSDDLQDYINRSYPAYKKSRMAAYDFCQRRVEEMTTPDERQEG